ncbi:7701_t:CDS:1 [Acaulospora morrowiae]|uniref:7701_t:CDS:1 n=1 Tax=Acaulospora morrowiae TaxID=94023 RepID=A0A9N8YU02_9GLOM|nr:7701_t:CDS:1 [Acaulospora morrowiae]
MSVSKTPENDVDAVSNQLDRIELNESTEDKNNNPLGNSNLSDVGKSREGEGDDDFVNFNALWETLERVFQQPCKSISRIDQKTSNQIPYLVVMEDDSKYVVRISYPHPENQFHNYSESYAVKRLECEANLTSYVASCTNIPVPNVYYWNAKKNNDVGSEFVIMEYLRGIPLRDEWSDLSFEEKQEVLLQIIDILLTLKELEFPMIGSLYTIKDCEKSKMTIGECVFHVFMQSGRDETEDAQFGPFLSTREFLQAALGKELGFLESLDDECHQLWSPIQMQLIELFFKHFESKDHDLTFVICPSEISASKILLDRDLDGNIKISGFLAWDCTGTKPLECLYKYPLWIKNNVENATHSKERKAENIKLQDFFAQELFECDPDAKKICGDIMRNHFITAILEEYMRPWSIHKRIQLMYDKLNEGESEESKECTKDRNEDHTMKNYASESEENGKKNV